MGGRGEMGGGGEGTSKRTDRCVSNLQTRFIKMGLSESTSHARQFNKFPDRKSSLHTLHYQKTAKHCCGQCFVQPRVAQNDCRFKASGGTTHVDFLIAAAYAPTSSCLNPPYTPRLRPDLLISESSIYPPPVLLLTKNSLQRYSQGSRRLARECCLAHIADTHKHELQGPLCGD